MAKKKMSLEEQIEKGLTDLAFGSCCDAVMAPLYDGGGNNAETSEIEAYQCKRD